jgi:hypothetical protein
MFPEHSRAGEAHDYLDLFPSIPLVTMNRAPGAGRLVFAKAAAVQPQVDVAHQVAASRAQIAALVLVATVNPEHRRDRLPFPG